MNEARRSVLLAILGGMMAAAFLHSEGIVNLGYGFPRGGLGEGVVMAITGGVAGYAVLRAFRTLRDFAAGDRK